jgi:integrase
MGGEPWADHDWRNWRRRTFAPLAASVGLSSVRPYDLRHAFCSLLLAEGRSVEDIARQVGHSPAMTLDTYGHVIDEIESTERRPADVVIREAPESIASRGSGSIRQA